MSPSDRQAYHDLNWSGSEYAPKFERFGIAIGDESMKRFDIRGIEILVEPNEYIVGTAKILGSNL